MYTQNLRIKEWKQNFAYFLKMEKINYYIIQTLWADTLKGNDENCLWGPSTLQPSSKNLCFDGTKIKLWGLNFKHCVWRKARIHHMLNTISIGPCSSCCLWRLKGAKYTEWKPDSESSDWAAGLHSNKTTTLSSRLKHQWISSSGLAWTLP